MPRFRFDLGLSNAIRQSGLRHDRLLSEEPPLTNQKDISHSERMQQSVRWLLAPFRRPARFFRNFLLGAVQHRLDLIERHNELLQNQISNIRETLNAFRGDANRDTAHLFRRVDALETGLHELALRARVPIQVDALTLAVRTADGFVFVPRSDTLLLLMLYDAGPQGLEPGTRRLLATLLSEGMTFIDVGAHVGLLTLTGARAVGPRGRVLALEPTPAAFDLLTRAVAVNGLGELVVAKRLACGARRDRRAFYIGRVLGHSSLCALAPESMETEIEVDVEPLDELVRPGDRVDVVKLDVEGAELDVLAGMTRIIRENANLAIVAEFGHSHLLRTGISPEAWFGAFRAHGLEAYAIDELSGHCRPSGPWDLANVESINVLFCGPNSRVAAHVKS